MKKILVTFTSLTLLFSCKPKEQKSMKLTFVFELDSSNTKVNF
jgi:hypothetical protein